jgi:hypothetical protein
MLVVAMGGVFIIEQPGSSLLMEHPRMKWLCKQLKVP